MDGGAPHPALDRSKSIQDLEAVVWPSPAVPSYVAQASFALRRKKLADLTDEDLRVGLEQQVGVPYLVPIALERLGDNPFVEARLYEGDLLDSLLNVPASFWKRNAAFRQKAERLASRALAAAAGRNEVWRATILPGLLEAYDRFAGRISSRTWLRAAEGATAPPVS